MQGKDAFPLCAVYKAADVNKACALEKMSSEICTCQYIRQIMVYPEEKRMDRKGSKQLYNKLLFIDTVILVCAISAMVTYFYTSTKNRFLEQNLNYTEMMSESVASYLEDSSDIAEYIHEDLYKSDMELKDALHYMTDDPSDYQKYRLDTYSENKISEYRGVEKFFLDALQAYESLNYIMLYSYERDEITAYTRDGKCYRREGEEVFKSQFEKGDLAGEDSFCYLKEIREPATMQVKGCMILGFWSDRFETIQKYYSRGELIVYNDAGTEVFASSREHVIADIINAEDKGILEDVLGPYVEHIQDGPYHAVCYLEKKRAARVPASIIIMILAVGIAVMILGEFFVRYHLQKLAKRLNRILDGMAQVMSGDLSMRIPADKNGDELDVISQCFNEMCVNLDEHIKRRYLAEIEQKDAEMSALQSQINPHFLYNTLETIRMKAICNGDREVGKMLYSLAVTFRAQIKEADVITLAQELHYSKKYMELFEFRYQNQFQSVVECPEEYLQVPVIKFVLQPVIENYFIHGIRMKEQDNFIHIFVEKEEGYRIIVEDNGKGMTEEEIEAKNKELDEDIMKKQASIGISNVNRRLKAVYGKEYGIHMEARPEGGLRVILRFRPEEGIERKD